MDEDIKNWLQFADSDMISAEALHRIGQELNCLFFLQQAVEKTLKALLVKQTSVAPPRTHNLPKLAALCGLQLPSEQAQLLDDLVESYIDSRYPEEWGSNPPKISGEETERLISASKELVRWLRRKL